MTMLDAATMPGVIPDVTTMLYMNPKVARPDPRRPHARPVLNAGESLYHGGRPLIALDGTTDATTPEDWAELRASVPLIFSVGGWDEADGSNHNQ